MNTTTTTGRIAEDEHASGAVPRRPVTIVRATGATLFDQDGNRYIDCAAAHGWAGVGHSHPHVVRAIQEQAAVLVMATESSYNNKRADWFQAIVGIVNRQILGPASDDPFQYVIPTNSGAEAIEAALKLARLKTGRSDYVAFHRGFHGRTMGALSVTATARYRHPFEPLVPGVHHVQFNDAAALDEAITDRTAAVILEIVQGEGGVHEASGAFVDAAATRCRERGALLVVDEVQTGLGRTGRWFACEWCPVEPDVLVLGKTLGGGIPMGATLWKRHLGPLPAGSHGSTFAGNPLACAASVAVLEVLQAEALPDRADRLGRTVVDRLRQAKLSRVRTVRGRGLMIGVELRHKVQPVLRTLLEAGVWAIPGGSNVLRLLPPLVIAEDDLERAVTTVVETLRHD